VDRKLDEIVGACLAVDPGDRFSSARVLLEELERWVPVTIGVQNSQKGLISSVDPAKSALGQHDPASERSARRKARKAGRIARQSSRINEAADLMEQAINEWPALREDYEYLLNLWRRGLTL
jgi:hypothetical protein